MSPESRKVKQHFFISDKFLGSAERLPEFVHAELQVPASYVFLCPRCGDAWAKAAVEYKDSWKWVPVMRYCRKHGDGRISMFWDADYMAALPFPVLLYEFIRELRLQGFENGE